MTVIKNNAQVENFISEGYANDQKVEKIASDQQEAQMVKQAMKDEKVKNHMEVTHNK